ncbi:MAG: MBL fold metallo-hydrolase [Firmicutes bacterium]|nr:MBL fold metallo-hydrolase [Bacillota bacterium]
MKITFYGAARTVTGSCYLLEHNGARFLVDCGLFQGNKALKERNYGEFPFTASSIDFVLLTHAHIDHSGLIPKLYNKGFKGKIYTTPATQDLCSIMLPDSGHIQESECERKNRKLARAGGKLLTPIYTADDANQVMRQFEAHDYGKTFSPAPGIRVTMRDAGHILGSAILEIVYDDNGSERTLVFSGDLGRYDAAIVNDPSALACADFLVMESTYGNRLHGGADGGEPERLAAAIRDTFAKGGNVVIPAFAVDRTQDILMMLSYLFDNKMIPEAEVYVDSPLAVKATQIFGDYPEYYDEITSALYNEKGHPPFLLPNLHFSTTAEESMRINAIKSGAIIISASGMADAGRIKHHLKHNLWRPECLVVFIGYQSEGTLGRMLIDGADKVTIHGEKINVSATIITMEGFSAHADRDELLRWLNSIEVKPQKVFVTHGEEASTIDFANTVTQQLGIAAEAPQAAESFELHLEGGRRVAQPQASDSPIDSLEVLAEINAALSELIMKKNMDQLLRLRDYLRGTR